MSARRCLDVSSETACQLAGNCLLCVVSNVTRDFGFTDRGRLTISSETGGRLEHVVNKTGYPVICTVDYV